jgi:MSHA pilin protein MshA
MNKQTGFTLVELVVVIVILGLLAATALPKFINVTSNARYASLEGVAGGLRSAASLARSQYIVNGSKTATTVTMDNSSVVVLDETTYPGLGGRPTAAATGMQVAMPNPDGFTVTSGTNTLTYTPTGGVAGTCSVTYTDNAVGDPVVVTGSNSAC